MSDRREFFDWSESLLPQVAAWMIDDAIDTADQETVIDRSQWICVLPGSRAGRLLLATLVEQCEQRGCTLIPPQVITPGVMFERLTVLNQYHDETTLHQPTRPASTAEQTLGWTQAIATASEHTLRDVAPFVADDRSLHRCRALARQVARLHRELAGQRMTFDDVARALDYSDDRPRWEALEQICNQYQQLFSDAGLHDLHILQRDAIEHDLLQLQPGVEAVVFIGVVEMNAVQRAVASMLGERGRFAVHAPARYSYAFDELGCALTDVWAREPVSLRDEDIAVVDRPWDQAQQILCTLLDRSSDDPAAVTIGLGNAALSGPINRALSLAGASAHDAAGRPVQQTLPIQLLKAVAAYLAEPRLSRAAVLLRHPDYEKCIQRRWKEQYDRSAGVLLTLVDTFLQDNLDRPLSELTANVHDDDSSDVDQTSTAIRRFCAMVNTMLGPLAESTSAPSNNAIRPLGEWCEPLLAVLREVYGNLTVGERSSAATSEACLMIRDQLRALAEAPDHLQPRVTAQQHVELLLDDLSDRFIADDLEDDQIEMLGWLELHLDTAPHLIIAGFNDGNVPTTAHSDPFLPDSLRQTLGLMCNQHRLGRDVLLMQAIIHSRASLQVVVGRQGPDNEPLTPSRLLFHCDDDATLLHRLRLTCSEPPPEDRALPIMRTGPATVSVIARPPQPDATAPATLERMRVTAFRDYLACPYRYYLQHVLGLERIQPEYDEMNALHFGSLAHKVLEQFAADGDAADSTDPAQIADTLLEMLHELAAEWFGARPTPAVQLQVAQLQQRLRDFAHCQAKLRRDGWQIIAAEQSLDEQCTLDIPGQDPILIRGKIDRIDQHETTGCFRIIDYKTTSSDVTPHSNHHGRETIPDPLVWVDLQLPLYHAMARQMNLVTSEVEVAYIILPKRTGGTRAMPAAWTNEHIDDAVDCAREIVKAIRAQRFELNRQFEGWFDDFRRICRSDTTLLHLDDDNESEAIA